MVTVDLDIDKFKVRPPWRDLSFWLAVLTSLPLLIPVVVDSWRARRVPDTALVLAGIAPITAWLLLHGYVRGEGVRAAGEATAALAPEIARHELVFGTEREAEDEHTAEGPMPEQDDPDTMPPPPDGCCALSAPILPREEG